MQMVEDLRLIRTTLGVSQERLGNLLGMSRNLLCRCESGKPVPPRRTQWVQWLAAALREMDGSQIARVKRTVGAVERGEMLIPDWWGRAYAIRQEGNTTAIS